MGADILNISPAMLNLIWLGLFILLLVIEIITVGLTTIWFAAGALAALAANVLGANLIIQIIIFLAVSVVLLIFTRPWAEKHLNRKRVRTNYEREIGKVIRITEKVDNLDQTGKSVVDGQEWTVRSRNDSDIFEAGALARIAKEHDVECAVGHGDANKRFSFIEGHGVDAFRARVAEGRKWSLLHRPPIRRHEDEMLIVIPLNREDKRDALLFFKRQKVDDRTPSRIRLSFGQLEDINWVNPARRRKAENDVMRIGDEDFLNFIVFRRRLNVTALAATNLGLVVGKLLTLHVAVARKRNDHVTTGNKVALVEIRIAQRINNRASFVAKLLSNRLEFVGNDGAYSGRFRKDVQVVENLVDLRAVVVNDLFTLKPRKAAQIHGQNAVDLSMGKVVETVFTKTAIGLHRFGIDLMAGGCSAPSDFS